MSRTIHDMPQRSPEWFAARLGKLTASRAADMLATIKSGEAAARRDLRVQLVLERITGQSQENGFVSADMQRGTDLEPAALGAFELLTGELAQTCGFVSLDGCEVGCSPDGYVGDLAELVSLKCPKSATHLGYLTGPKSVPSAYVPQMTHEMWVTGANRYHFLSYDNRFPEPLQVFHVIAERDEQAIAAYALAATQFLREVDFEEKRVRDLMGARG